MKFHRLFFVFSFVLSLNSAFADVADPSHVVYRLTSASLRSVWVHTPMKATGSVDGVDIESEGIFSVVATKEYHQLSVSFDSKDAAAKYVEETFCNPEAFKGALVKVNDGYWMKDTQMNPSHVHEVRYPYDIIVDGKKISSEGGYLHCP